MVSEQFRKRRCLVWTISRTIKSSTSANWPDCLQSQLSILKMSKILILQRVKNKCKLIQSSRANSWTPPRRSKPSKTSLWNRSLALGSSLTWALHLCLRMSQFWFNKAWQKLISASLLKSRLKVSRDQPKNYRHSRIKSKDLIQTRKVWTTLKSESPKAK